VVLHGPAAIWRGDGPRLELLATAEPKMVARLADDTAAAPPDAQEAPVKIPAGRWRSNATVTGEPMRPRKSGTPPQKP